MADTFVVICGLMRTGTTLLCRMFSRAGLGKPREYLHHAHPEFPTFADMARYIERHQSGNVVGVKLMPGQLWRAKEYGLAPDVYAVVDGMVEAVGAQNTAFIYMHRNDHKRQAISAIRAATANRWHCPANETPHSVRIPYTHETVDRFEFLRAEYAKNERLWSGYFASRGIVPFDITYEDFTRSDASIDLTFRAAVAHCGLALPADYAPDVPLKKQAGDDVEQWLAQYEAEHG